jgi:hypothetical protein
VRQVRPREQEQRARAQQQEWAVEREMGISKWADVDGIPLGSALDRPCRGWVRAAYRAKPTEQG